MEVETKSIHFLGPESALGELEFLRQKVAARWRIGARLPASGERLHALLIPDESFRPESWMNPPALTSTIFSGRRFTTERIAQLQSQVPSCFFLDLNQPLEEQIRILEQALERANRRFTQQQLLAEMRVQNKKIEELNTNLENIVIERTRNESDSRQATKRALDRVRALVGFVQDLNQSVDLPEILNLVRREIKRFHGAGDPILYLPQPSQLVFFRNLQVGHKSVTETWAVSSRIRINSMEESQFLANQLGRPTGHVISFPLPAPRPEGGADASPVLYFEHSLPKGDVEAFLSFIGERLQPVSLAIDRILLERELKSASRVWEMTFDGLNEPIAILDMENNLLRANAHFHESLIPYLNSAGGLIRSGESRYVLEKYPVRMNSDQAPLSWVAYFRDETRSVKLKSQMAQIEKMSAIGQLAGHIAHELNNPLTGIRSLTQILMRDPSVSSQVRGDLSEVERAAQRCQSIINNLLEFSRGGLTRKSEKLDLNQLVERTLPLLKSVLGRLRSNVDLCAEPLWVKVEPHLMQQVIFNLVNNACQAIPGKGSVEVKTSREGSRAVLEVRDSGHGIPESIRELIFEPFFTTKNEGEGTGLGLSLSRDFIRQFGGEIECESELNRGSIFRVRLPLEKDS